MKNLSLILNIILIVAVAYLFIDKFSGSEQVEESTGTEQKDDKIYQNVAIAYVHSDSLLANYDFMQEIESELGELSQKYENEYQNRAQGLQNEISDFQRTAQNLTVAQGKALEENLMKKQQNLRVYQEDLSRKLRQKEAELNNELYKTISDYLKEYGDENNLQLVLTYSRGSDVLYANDGLEITNEVIEGLNNAFKQKADSAASK
ncbi:periplasmic chaperone for outer membrane proteins Skp [Marivirga sericea]|uniref:Periplasmic chaperone for outer membrane proteins Skp n=1 Tax=Marivirga sericea TaxID=1028 RepID=A0A1X7IQG6_9BACT|nr:OmpH family outer membrane protein [Marivirga sericea]SMG16979.1 periplasmic chaperone for outer membrane proteins Skp [Marivirga sericea]